MKPVFILLAATALAGPVAAQPIIVPLTPQKRTEPPPPPPPSPVPVAPPQANSGDEVEATRAAPQAQATRRDQAEPSDSDTER